MTGSRRSSTTRCARNDVPADRLIVEVAARDVPTRRCSAGAAAARTTCPGRSPRCGRWACGSRSTTSASGSLGLAQLPQLPVDLVKVDRSLFADPASALVDVVITLGNRLGFEVAAVGVETDAELATLRAAGCATGQGNLLGRPAHAERVEAYLEEHRRPPAVTSSSGPALAAGRVAALGQYDRMQIRIVTPAEHETLLPGLIEVLRDSVDSGASVGFVASPEPAEAARWWIRALAGPGRHHLGGRRRGRQPVGTVQLVLPWQDNGRHRAEIVKLMVHRKRAVRASAAGCWRRPRRRRPGWAGGC